MRTGKSRRWPRFLALSLVTALGCNQAESAPEPSASAAPPAPPAQAPTQAAAQAPAEPAPSQVEDAAFSLRLVEAGPYKAGELGRVVVQLEPRGEYHVNQDYPFELTVVGDAKVSFPKATLAKADAAEFGDARAKFDVPFTAAVGGEYRISAQVKFAVCTEETCVPDERKLSLPLSVM